MMTRARHGTMVALAVGAAVWLSGAQAHAAASYRFNTHWKTTFVDGAQGEDHDAYPPGHSGYVPARRAYYELYCDSWSNIIGAGVLDDSGRTPDYEIEAGTVCALVVFTVLIDDSGGRGIMVTGMPDQGDPNSASSYQYSIAYFVLNETSGAYMATIAMPDVGPVINVTAVAGKFMREYIAQRTPPNWYLPVIVHTDCEWSHFSKWRKSPWTTIPTVCIDTSIHDDDNGNWSYYDHSDYKFVVGHELGHYQAYLKGMPLDTNSGREAGPQNPLCSALHHNAAATYQSQEYTGFAQTEAWAFFYALTLYNARTAGSCGMGYWHSLWMFDPYTPAWTLDYDPPPVRVECAVNQRWHASNCLFDKTGKCTMTDWVNFLWNVWTVGGSNRFGVRQLSEVWAQARPSQTSGAGPSWAALLNTVRENYSTDKYRNFRDRAVEARVNF